LWMLIVIIRVKFLSALDTRATVKRQPPLGRCGSLTTSHRVRDPGLP